MVKWIDKAEWDFDKSHQSKVSNEWLKENPEIIEKYFSPNDGSGIADQIKGLKKQLESADLAFYKSLTLEDFEKWLVYLHKNK